MKIRATLILFLALLILLTESKSYSQIGSKEKKIAYSINLMKNQLKKMKDKHSFEDDSLRIEVLNRIAALYVETSKDSALFYANDALRRADILKQQNLIAVSYHNIGEAFDFYKDTINAEKNLLGCYQIRKEQGGNKFRWALNRMREFYSKYKMIDKLKKIEEEWIAVLDKQYDDKKLSPWIPEDYSIETDYRLSMYPVFRNLIELKEYFILDTLFKHMAQKCPGACDWLDSDMPYYTVESVLLSNKDTATLTTWYNHWFSTLNTYCRDKNMAFETFKIISNKYFEGYYDYSEFSEKYSQKMLNFSYRMGGDSAVYELLKHYLDSYSINTYQRFKFNLFALKICIKTYDTENADKYYMQLGWTLDVPSSLDDDSKIKILNLLKGTEKSAQDEKLKEWCRDAVKKLE